MLVYHYLNAKFGLKDLTERRLKIARIMELNDTFEFLGVDLSDRDFRKVIKKTKKELSQTHGLLCFSKTWKNPILWSHYADKHKGLCLGFDMSHIPPTKVEYVRTRFQKPDVLDEIFMKKLLFTKFIHWKYEEEYRSYLSLEEKIDGIYYANFSDSLALKRVIIGDQCQLTHAEISAALGDLEKEVQVFKVRAAFKSFEIVRNKNNSLWG